MSATTIGGLLEQALATIAPPLATASENAAFTMPAPTVAYQRVAILLAEPANIEMSRDYVEQGFMQVDLKYPLNAGAGPALGRAELIRQTFFRGASFTGSGVTVNIEKTPEIMPARVEEDRFVVPVRIRFYAHILGS